MIPVLFALVVAAQAPDSARQLRYEQVLNGATDALDRVRGAAAGFRADLPSASSDLVLQRAERVRVSCRGAGGAVGAVDSLLAEVIYVSRARREQDELRKGGVELRRVLTRCERDWTAPSPQLVMAADTLRAWGPYRTSQLETALRRYLASLRAFMKKAALRKPAVS